VKLPKPSAVVFAKDGAGLAHFYAAVAEMNEVFRDEVHIVLDHSSFQIVIHSIPERIAQQIEIDVPPKVRGDTPIKLCLPVATLERARAKAAELGGGIRPRAEEWSARDFRACDGFDPEGNVFQAREATE